MKTLTADEFKRLIDGDPDTGLAGDPAWASKLTEPVEITGFCEMINSRITHLSPFLHFTGRDENGDCANFYNCKKLKVAEGTFEGWVDFKYSEIEKIGDLTITQPDQDGNTASFYKCKNLKIAEGIFDGFVSFSRSGVERIGNLVITQPNRDGESARFINCKSLTLPKAWLERTGISIDADLRQRSEQKLRDEADARKAMKQPTFEL